MITRIITRSCLALVLLVSASVSRAQTISSSAEQGTFHLHKFEQLIGSEKYTLTSSQSEVVLKSDFKFTDRGDAVPLMTSLTMEKDLTPRDFQIKGKTSRFSPIEDSVHGRSAGQVTVAAGENFFDTMATLRFPCR
jgi:hypothetical protein